MTVCGFARQNRCGIGTTLPGKKSTPTIRYACAALLPPLAGQLNNSWAQLHTATDYKGLQDIFDQVPEVGSTVEFIHPLTGEWVVKNR